MLRRTLALTAASALAVAGTLTLAAPAQATSKPAPKPAIGTTTVTLTEAALGALGPLNPAPVAPSTLGAGDTGVEATFPITRVSSNGVIAHSDAGAQYVSVAYTERLAEIGARPSIGSIGDSYDNSLAESVNGLYKTELIRRQGPWRNVEHVELATLAWVDWFNNRRLHSELGDIPPAEFEHDYYARTRSHQQTPTPTRT